MKPYLWLLALVFVTQVAVSWRNDEQPSGQRTVAGVPSFARLDRGPSLGSHDATRGASSEVALGTALGGTATWYCSKSSACTRGYHPSDMVAAIDPSLGIRKGTLLTVSHGGRSIVVRAVDVCACAGRRLIDLTSGAFARLSPLSAGVIAVTIVPATLPATDLEE